MGRLTREIKRRVCFLFHKKEWINNNSFSIPDFYCAVCNKYRGDRILNPWKPFYATYDYGNVVSILGIRYKR